MLNLSVKELKLIAENGDIKVYERMSGNKLLIILNTSEPIKENKPIRDIRKENSEARKILKYIEPSSESKNKIIKDIRRKNYDAFFLIIICFFYFVKPFTITQIQIQY